MKAETGIIGGSGFYNMDLKDPEYITIDTPFGAPSEKILTGTLDGKQIAFISRHGIGHRLNPSEVNYRANLYALKTLGVKNLISVTAVGSLKEELKPTDLVIPSQYFDNTFKREKTYFEKGIVAHVSMAQPVCEDLCCKAFEIAKAEGISVHKGGTYFNMEGPQFSSLSESLAYRQLGFDIIGMTQAIEAKLAKEMEFCFLPLAFVTDYDCWHEETASVTVEMVVEYLNKNVNNANMLIKKLVNIMGTQSCNCDEALATAVMTRQDLISEETKEKLKPIISKYIK